jgi:hypothetical protein
MIAYVVYSDKNKVEDYDPTCYCSVSNLVSHPLYYKNKNKAPDKIRFIYYNVTIVTYTHACMHETKMRFSNLISCFLRSLLILYIAK